jgi:hypothetical protein
MKAKKIEAGLYQVVIHGQIFEVYKLIDSWGAYIGGSEHALFTTGRKRDIIKRLEQEYS